MEFCFLFVVALIFGFVSDALGRSKGQTNAFLWGFFLGPFGMLIVLMLPEVGRNCPYCMGIVPAGAVKCKHCGSDLPSKKAAKVEYYDEDDEDSDEAVGVELVEEPEPAKRPAPKAKPVEEHVTKRPGPKLLRCPKCGAQVQMQPSPKHKGIGT